MSADSNDSGGAMSPVPEPVLDWVDLGRPEPVPPEVRAWLDRDPGHPALLDELVELWAGTEARVPTAELWAAIYARITSAPPTAVRAEASTRAPHAAGRRSRWPAGLRLAAMLVLGLGLGALWPQVAAHVLPGPGEVILEVPAGSRSSLALPGGVAVRLNAGSRLTYQPDGGRVNEVRLDGEAFFDIEHDPSRSFTVVTAAGVIRDIGTRFNVEARGEAVAVVVTEGEVALTSGGVTLPVLEGQKALATGAGAPRMEDDFLLDAELAWLEGKLAFHDTPLEEIARALERHYDADVAVAERLARRRVTLVLDAPAEIGAALEIVCQAVSASCEGTGGAWRVGSDR